MFNPLFDQSSPVSDLLDKQESSTLSDGSCTATRRASHSDEEFLLATSRPKKRAGRRVFKETRHPIFRGVRERNGNKWVCELREPNKKSRIWLGTYPTAEMAARAHDVAALALRGKSACLNFADSAWRLPVPASTDSKEIRKTAAEAAEAFRPQEFEEVSDSCEAKHEGTVKADASSEVFYCKDKLEEAKPLQLNRASPVNLYFVDEDALFDMPGLLRDMAEGLLLSPPSLIIGDDMNWDYVESDARVPLWSHSF